MSVHDPSKHHRNFARDLRRKAVARSNRQGRSGKPMTVFRWLNRFKPPVNDTTWVRLIPGIYKGFDGDDVPYFDYVEHYNATVRSGTICSRVWREGPDGSMEGSGKCIPCHAIEEEGADNISWRRLSAFLLLHLDWYYLIPATDENGNVLTYRKDSKKHKAGDVIYNRIHEAEAFKEYGRATIRREKYEKVWGNLMHWSLGTNHLLVLSSMIDSLEDECRCGGEIETLLWECPGCGNEVFDLTSDDLDYTRGEINQLVSKKYECPHCSKLVFLAPVTECSKCKNPDPLQIWDVDLCVGREGEGTSSQLIIRKHKHVEIDKRCRDLIPDRPLLQRVFAGDSLEYQAKRMRLDNPWAEDAARRNVEDYDGDEGEVEDDIPF